jgi:hypothetical protein
MAKSHLRVVAPTEVKRTVPPKRSKNAELPTREHFTPDEVEALIEAARGNRYGHRDATLILLTYRHFIIRGRQKRNLTACVPNHHSDFTSGGMGSSNYLLRPLAMSSRIASLREIRRAFAQASIAEIIFVSARTPIMGSLPVAGRPRASFWASPILISLASVLLGSPEINERVPTAARLPDLTWRQESLTIPHLHRLFAVSVFPFATAARKNGQINRGNNYGQAANESGLGRASEAFLSSLLERVRWTTAWQCRSCLCPSGCSGS